jgi:hypothetical protein
MNIKNKAKTEAQSTIDTPKKSLRIKSGVRAGHEMAMNSIGNIR